MRREPGKVQREVLTVIEGSADVLDTFVIARMVYGVRPREFHLLSKAQLSAVRRALRGLAKAGKIVRVGRNRINREMWVMPAKAAEIERNAAASTRGT
jgi:hypothetical protein